MHEPDMIKIMSKASVGHKMLAVKASILCYKTHYHESITAYNQSRSFRS